MLSDTPEACQYFFKFLDANLKLARFPRSRRGFTFYVADPSVPFTNSDDYAETNSTKSHERLRQLEPLKH
jgi:hypothetical protein